MTGLVDRLRRLQSAWKNDPHGVGEAYGQAADEIDKLRAQIVASENLCLAAAGEIELLREALQAITDHFADVMGGPMIRDAGIEFKDGVEGIPTIAKARAALGREKKGSE